MPACRYSAGMEGSLDNGPETGKRPVALDGQIAELLVSRLCHELAGPLGGLSNGVEFLADIGGDAGDDVAGLLGDSARRASAALQFYRLAYGTAGLVVREPSALSEAAAAFASARGISLTWNAAAEPLLARPPAAKLALLLVEVGCDALLRGGGVAVEDADGGIMVTAEGDRSALREDLAEALTDCEAGRLTPRNCHAGYAAKLAAAAGWRIDRSADPDSVRLRLFWPEG